MSLRWKGQNTLLLIPIRFKKHNNDNVSANLLTTGEGYDRKALFKLSGMKADVAQPVEQLIRNQQVSGSNPLIGSRFQGVTIFRNPFFVVNIDYG